MPRSTASTPARNGRGAGARPRSGATAAAPQTAAPASGAAPPGPDAIAQRAYELYEAEGRQPGRDLEYWLRAEAELTGRGNV